MRPPRLLPAALLLALLTGGAVAAIAWQAAPPPGHESVRVHLIVEGPAGRLFEGPVTASPPTALRALEASGLAVETESYPGMGTYVRAVAEHRARGPAGWIYDVDGAFGDRSAEAAALDAGARVTWRWTEGGA